MDLIAAYGDEDDGPVAQLQPKVTVSKPVELAPYVNPDESERRLRFVSPYVRELAYNPKVEAMLAPVQGPVDPNARKTLAAEMNTPTGYVEAASMHPTIFNDQFHMFASRKYAYDPSGPAMVNGQPMLIGKVENAAKPEHEQDKERKNFMKQKRKKQGDVTNPTEFLGPWAPYEEEKLPPIKYPGYVEGAEGPAPEGAETAAGPEVAPKVTKAAAAAAAAAAGSDEEPLTDAAKKAKLFEPPEDRRAREKEEMRAKSHADQSEREKQLAMSEDVGAKTVLHIANTRDYLGRTFMVPPSDLKNKPHDCYVPKKVVHTFSGHTKGVSVRHCHLCTNRPHETDRPRPSDFSPNTATCCSQAAWTTKSFCGTSITTTAAASAPTWGTRRASAMSTSTMTALAS